MTANNGSRKPSAAPSTAYLDFELEIDAPDGDGICAVRVLRAPGGDAASSFDFNALSPEARTWSATGATGATAAAETARTVGRELFDRLFAGELLRIYDVSRQLAASQHAGLRIRLRLEHPALRQLPWELLYDARSDDFLALSRATPLVRYLPVGAPAESLTVQPPLRILAMTASPTDLPPVDGEAERANLTAALERLTKQGEVELVWLAGSRWSDLQEAMQQGPWHIFHFVGHARLNPQTGLGEAIFVDDSGRSAPADAAALATLLEDHQTLRLAVFNACEGARADEAQPFGSLAAALVQRGLSAVLAMQQEISTGAAQRFTRAFYGALASRLPVDAALAEARKAMQQATPDSAEWATPVLFLRSADAALFAPLITSGALATMRPLLIGGFALLFTLIGFIWWRTIPAAPLPTPSPTATHLPTPTPTITPTPTPSQMTGSFRIAIADFGQLNADGSITASPLGSEVSRSIYENLTRELGRLTLDDGIATDITIWHDSAGSAQKNVTFGYIPGATTQARTDNARALADLVDADMVVFGQLEWPPSQDDSDRLQIEFLNRATERSGEPSATAGSLTFGSPLVSSIPFSINPSSARSTLNLAASWRATALFWITQGLTRLLADDPQGAIAIFDRALARLENMPRNSGKEVVYLFKAQAAQIAREYDTALEALTAAEAERPDYLNARIQRGAILLDRAQLHYLNPDNLTVEELACTSAENLANASPTDEAARADAEEAVRQLETALTDAQASPWPEIVPITQLNLGLAYRILGQIDAIDAYNALVAGDAPRGDLLHAQAVEHLNMSVATLQNALSSLSIDRQPQYVGWTQAALGVAYQTLAGVRYTQSVVALNAGNADAEMSLRQDALLNVNEALANYDACVELRPQTRGNPTFQSRVLHCTCELSALRAQSLQIELGAEQ